MDISEKILETKKKLTEKQRLFAEAYVMGLSEQEAVRAAKYKMASDDNWRRDAYRLAKLNMKNGKVRNYIELLREQMASSLVVDKLYVVEKLKNLAENGETENIKIKALELLGKTFSMFTDKVETKTESSDPAELMRRVWEKKKERKLMLVKRGDESETKAS